MKIISKYKDFYDYLVQDNEPDMTYVRKPFLIMDNIIHERINWSNYNRNYDAIISNIIFGVYPYIYNAPYIKIRVNSITGNSEYFLYFFTKEDLYNIHANKDVEKLCSEKAKEYCVKHQNCRPLSKYVYEGWYYKRDAGEIIKNNNVLKKENKKIFEKIGAPVFIQNKSDVIDFNIFYENNFNYHDFLKTKFIGNVTFTKIGTDIIRYWIDELMDINTYNNIENFLWSIKQEPIANPDNKTKIISHGFDLKESFRNIK